MKFYQPFRVQLSFTAFYIEFSSYKMSSKRVLTYLKRGQDIVLAPFGQCVVSSFVKDYTEQNEVEIHCDLAPQVKNFIILQCLYFSICLCGCRNFQYFCPKMGSHKTLSLFN